MTNEDDKRPAVVRYVEAHNALGEFLDRFLKDTVILSPELMEEYEVLEREAETARIAWEQESRGGRPA
ncbi:hypothetical protein UFOVP1383_46 [uncultured Caudovirales phage]|uniref:Uncharacterized protein n=1 Tax=uncultured Caudovirales phage TaxID=2100421 RepID=A0A6J5SP29_9CAUD|nr:hypothetical protein UFOVP848_54 [uncultured Caudovirales phage]CAB4173031.1 hypothetical protein UFOVP945_11 [uncultured Caudovirales phage]CAB4179645.1 hypothetical protein UFOVP1023_31 [uncultured Caudovirales phage]CAB4204269.1 hypothetical protein UFOVP1383_46 [uncultured Caudovirales phage]CAB4215798.1 hypothetical protein UFOVP1477_2 [uncultured Caudovirales phage]